MNGTDIICAVVIGFAAGVLVMDHLHKRQRFAEWKDERDARAAAELDERVRKLEGVPAYHSEGNTFVTTDG